MAAPKCGRPTRQTGKPCTQTAGWGTDHPGEGACKLHGGCTPIKHGRYSQIKGHLGDKIQEHLDRPDPLNLLPELASLMALLEIWLKKHEEPETILDLAGAVSGAIPLVGGIRKTVDTIHKMQTRELLTSREMEMGLMEIARIIAEEVKEPDKIARIAKRIEAAFAVHVTDSIRAIAGER
jgi:hypothetical protein